MLNRVPVYPCIGNHDTAESEDRDDREQLLDNMYLRERIASAEASGRASVDPGLFYQFRYGRDVEFICLDTSKEGFFRGKRHFLLVTIDGDMMTVRPIGEPEPGEIRDLPRRTPDGQTVTGPIVIRR